MNWSVSNLRKKKLWEHEKCSYRKSIRCYLRKKNWDQSMKLHKSIFQLNTNIQNEVAATKTVRFLRLEVFVLYLHLSRNGKLQSRGPNSLCNLDLQSLRLFSLPIVRNIFLKQLYL